MYLAGYTAKFYQDSARTDTVIAVNLLGLSSLEDTYNKYNIFPLF
jgi:hypothetical protein